MEVTYSLTCGMWFPKLNSSQDAEVGNPNLWAANLQHSISLAIHAFAQGHLKLLRQWWYELFIYLFIYDKKHEICHRIMFHS